jgi:hypothetical protein
MTNSLKAGIAWADITPPAFTFMTGMGGNRPRPSGVHDRLKARALVLASGGRTVALVTTDINYLPFDSVNELRRLVEKYTDIKGCDVKVTSSHSHSSPGIFELYKDPAQTTKRWGPIAEEEREHVHAACRLIAGAVYEADRNLVDAQIGFGRGTSKCNIIRWHLTPDGKMRYIPYHRELPANQEPRTDMFILHVRERVSGHTLAFWYTNSAHAICVCLQSDKITADYPGVVARIIERKFGGLCQFAPGTIGDQHPREFDRGIEAADRMGRQLAREIVKAQESMDYTSDVRIALVEKELEIPDVEPGGELNLRTRISALALNEVALSFWPGEPFSVIARRIESESPFATTAVVANTDDFKHYFSLEKDYARYEWDSDGARPSVYPVRAGDMLTDEMLALLRGLKERQE